MLIHAARLVPHPHHPATPPTWGNRRAPTPPSGEARRHVTPTKLPPSSPSHHEHHEQQHRAESPLDRIRGPPLPSEVGTVPRHPSRRSPSPSMHTTHRPGSPAPAGVGASVGGSPAAGSLLQHTQRLSASPGAQSLQRRGQSSSSSSSAGEGGVGLAPRSSSATHVRYTTSTSSGSRTGTGTDTGHTRSLSARKHRRWVNDRFVGVDMQRYGGDGDGDGGLGGDGRFGHERVFTLEVCGGARLLSPLWVWELCIYSYSIHPPRYTLSHSNSSPHPHYHTSVLPYHFFSLPHRHTSSFPPPPLSHMRASD